MEHSNVSLFAQVLGAEWQKLHPAVRRHYDLCPKDELILQGEMREVYHSL